MKTQSKQNSRSKSTALVDPALFQDLLEIIAEINDAALNKQIEESYEEHERDEAEQGLSGLIKIMRETRRKELRAKKSDHMT